MANIRISPDTMRGRANEFRKEADAVDQSINSMNRLLNQLQDEWEGEASKSYANRYNSELRPSFEKARDMINEIAQALDKTAQEMQDMDQRIASGFRG